MKPLKSVNLRKLQRIKAPFYGIILSISGLVIPLYILLPRKAAEVPKDLVTLVLLAAGGVLLANYSHPYYHLLITRLITYGKVGTSKKDGKIIIPLFFSRWEAVFIKLAPLTDLTILGTLGLALLPGMFLPAFLTFISANLWHSAFDAVHAFYIFKLAEPPQLIRWTSTGFEVWE